MAVQFWVSLILFAAVFLTATLHLLSAIGQFPREERAAVIATGAGTLVLYLSVLVVLAVIAASIWTVSTALPWYAAILSGGAAVLIAPLLLSYFSDEFVDGYGALIVFSSGALAALALMWFLR